MEETVPRLGKQCLVKLNEIKLTKTADFLLPLLGFSKNYYSPFLVNAYLGDMDVDGYHANKIYLLISNHKMDMRHKRLEDSIKSIETFEDHYDILDSRMTVYILSIPSKFYEDYKHFLNGKYSLFSMDARVAILKGRSENSNMPHIFQKDRALRVYWENVTGGHLPEGAEVWPAMIIEEEIFDKQKLLI